MTNFLTKQGDVYYVRLAVPKDLQSHYGKVVFKKSLQTKDIQEAKALLGKIISAWKTDFQHVRGNVRGNWKIELYEAVRPLLEIIRHSVNSSETTAARKQLEQIRETYNAKYGDAPIVTTEVIEDYHRVLESSIRYQLQNPGRLHPTPENPIDTFRPGPLSIEIKQIAEGHLVPKVDLFRKALRTKFASYDMEHLEKKTHDMRLGALEDLAKHFTSHQLPLDKSGVTEYLKSIESLAANTKRRKLSVGKLYFEFLQEEGVVSKDLANPFSGIKLKVNQKVAAKAKRQHFKRTHIEKLYAEAIKRKDQPLADCILIGAYTGLRIEEICQLTPNSIDDAVFTVTDAKTEAGWREVPIHSAIIKHIDALCKASTDGYLIPSSADNKYSTRSVSLSKRFSTIRDALSFGPEHVFHSIRKTVTTTIEQAGFTESVAADILGHKKPTMTFGTYSGGSSMDQRRAAIEALSYNFPSS